VNEKTRKWKDGTNGEEKKFKKRSGAKEGNVRQPPAHRASEKVKRIKNLTKPRNATKCSQIVKARIHTCAKNEHPRA